MSEIRVTTVSDTAGTGPVTLTKQSAAKAWAGNVTDSAVSSSSFNISSISDTGTGDNRLNLTNNMSAANYSVVSMVGPNAATPRVISLYDSPAASYRVFCTVPSSDGASGGASNTTAFGDLA